MLRRFFDYQSTTARIVILTFVIGFGSGVMTWLVLLGLERFVLTPIFCQTHSGSCAAVPTAALILALLVVQFVALVALVRIGVLRPLLVVLAAIMSLWGFQVWCGGNDWWMGALECGLMFGLAYLAFAWINRLLSFPVALIVTICAVIAARLLVITW